MARHKYFGTDGMRGRANIAPIIPQTILALAMAAGARFQRGNHRNRVVIGKDTRLSGYMVETALTSGFLAMGMDVLLLGPVPTPAVAMLTRSMRAELGVMVSASHNPYYDNGIKLFGPDGYKLSDEDENIIAEMMDKQDWQFPQSENLGRASRIDDATGRYIEYVKNSFPSGLRLDGLRLVVDCAHGAAYKIAPLVLKELGAEVIAIGVAPDGKNINQGHGAMHLSTIAAKVIAEGADLGIALDGDADRLIIVDSAGTIVDGDQILAIIAMLWQEQGRLRGPVVATILSNFGLENFLKANQIPMIRTPVGDRHVVQAMHDTQANLGGEASGHIVLGDNATTGDGLMAALQVLAALIIKKKTMSELARSFDPTPQVTRNIETHKQLELSRHPEILKAISIAKKELENKGRIVVRPSGTEPKLRIMVEGVNLAEINLLADHLEAKVRRFI